MLEIIAEPQKIEERTQEWHTQRASGIGGSEAAAVLGYSRWATPLDVWDRKTGKAAPSEDSEYFRRGRIREPQIIQEYSNLTGRVVRRAENLEHPKYSFIHANLDGIVPGDRLIEAKTAQAFCKDWGEPGTEEVPIEYYLQTQHYMLVAVELGLIPAENPICDLVVSIGGEPIQVYPIEGVPDLWEAMIMAYKEFWESVELKIPPAPVNAADRLRMVETSQAESKFATPEIVQMVGKLKRVGTAIDRLQERERELRTELTLYAGVCDTVLKKDGSTLYTCKSTKPRTSLDTERLKDELPDVYSKYLRTGKSTRPVRIR